MRLNHRENFGRSRERSWVERLFHQGTHQNLLPLNPTTIAIRRGESAAIVALDFHSDGEPAFKLMYRCYHPGTSCLWDVNGNAT